MPTLDVVAELNSVTNAVYSGRIVIANTQTLNGCWKERKRLSIVMQWLPNRKLCDSSEFNKCVPNLTATTNACILGDSGA